MRKILLVDCDGTLHDNHLRLTQQAQAACGAFGVAPEELIRLYFASHTEIHETEMESHDDVARHFELVGTKCGKTITRAEAEDLAHRWAEAYDAYQKHPVVYPDVIPFLDEAKRQGYELMLASGSTEEERWALLHAMGLDHYFTRVFAANTIGAQKRDPRFYEAVLADLNVSGSEVSIVGDDPGDDLTAKRFGIRTVFLRRPGNTKTFDEFQPDAEVADLSGVLPALEKTTQPKRLLVLVQAVDEQDALMGFFVRWLAEAAASCSQMTVLALRVGQHALPPNVTVIPLRSANSRSKWEVISTVWRESWKRRSAYDAVYVRGDYQYPMLAGWLWRLLGKRVILFYAHYTARPLMLRVAGWFSNVVVTSVRAACPLSTCMPIGQAIDAAHFSQMHEHAATDARILSYGRISPIKRVAWMIREIAAQDSELAKQMIVMGKETSAEAAKDLQKECESSGTIWDRKDVAYADAPAMYQTADLFVNATPGSLDKTIVEACFSNLLVIASTSGYGEMLPEDLKWLNPSDAEFGAAVARAARLAPAERQRVASRVREIALARHSQSQQITKVLALAFGE